MYVILHWSLPHPILYTKLFWSFYPPQLIFILDFNWSILSSIDLYYPSLIYTTLQWSILPYKQWSSDDQYYPPLIYTTLHWSILPSIDLYYPLLIYTTLNWSIQHSIDLYYTRLIYTTLYWSILHSIDLYYTPLIYTTLFWFLLYPSSTFTVPWATQTYICVMCIKTQILTIKCSLNWSTYILHLEVHLYSSL